MGFTSRRELSAFSRSTSSSEAASAEAASLLIVSRSSLACSSAACVSFRKVRVLMSSCSRLSVRRFSSDMDCLAADRFLRSPGTSSAAFALACGANRHCKVWIHHQILMVQDIMPHSAVGLLTATTGSVVSEELPLTSPT